MSKLTAFTLIELLVVLGIIAVVTGLSFQGLLVFRQTAQFQQAESDFISLLRSTQNKARNSVASTALIKQGNTLPQAQVDGYALVFATENYSQQYCFGVNTANGLQYDCTGDENPNLKPQEYAEVSINPTDTSKCRAIFFERLTGDISALSAEYAKPVNTGSCTIVINHTSSGILTRTLKIDLENNSFDIE